MFGSLIQLRLRRIRPIKKKLVFSVLKWLQSYKPYTCLASPILIYSTLNPVDFFLTGSSHGDQDNDLFKDGLTGSTCLWVFYFLQQLSDGAKFGRTNLGPRRIAFGGTSYFSGSNGKRRLPDFLSAMSAVTRLTA